jgi:hypothetical protein
MPNFGATKLMDGVLGVDVHAVIGFPIHPFFGPLFLWHTPSFPMANVFINGLPAVTVGAMGYSIHIPQGAPVPPTPTNIPYWRRYLVQIPMVLCLMALTMLANIAIASIAALMPKPKFAEDFIRDVTGIDTSKHQTMLETIKDSFSSLVRWPIWIRLLMPPLPYCGAMGSSAVGSPNVTVNGGPLGFVAPLVAASCSDIPIVPNAVTIGFTNVMVGVSISDLLRGIAVNAAQMAIFHAVSSGVSRFQGQRGCGCK